MKIKTTTYQTMRRLPFVLTVILLGGGLTVRAQEQQNLNRDHNEQVTIIGSFDPTINQAYKINVKPEQKPLNFTKPEFTYQSLENEVETEIKASQVKPLAVRGDKRVKVYNNYLKAGIGSQLSPLLDFYHSSGKSGSHRFNAQVNHFSSFNDIADYSSSPYSKTKVGIGYEKYFKSHALDLGLEYKLNTNRYYGFKVDDFPGFSDPEDNLKQRFNLVRANIGLKSKYKSRDKLHHTIGLSGYYYFDRHEARETHASLDFDFHKGFDLTDVLDYQNLGLEGELTYYDNTDSVRSSTDMLATFAPYFRSKYGILAFGVTLRFSYLNTESSSFHFYPVIDLSVAAIPEALVLYAGLDGNLRKNSYLDLTTENPYFTPYFKAALTSDTSLLWQNNKVVAFGGLRGNLAKKLGYNLEVRWSKFDDMAFFVTETGPFFPGNLNLNNKFTVYYDNGSLFTFKGEFSYAVSPQLSLWLNGQYNAYSLDSLEKAFHKPLTEVGLGASYLFLQNKLRVWTEMHYFGKRYASVLEVMVYETKELDAFLDLNLGADYKLTDKLSVFLTVTNVLNNNYQRFYNYPVQGINLIGGVTLKF